MIKPYNSNIKLIIYDFDGVMTNNLVLINDKGEESVFVNRSDGLAVEKIKKLGIKQAIISSENNPIVAKRAEKLGIECLYGVSDKLTTLKNYLDKIKSDKDHTLFIGNDINDLDAMEFVKYTICPNDAHHDVKKISRIITKAKGGEGVVREVLDLLMANNFV